MVESGVDGRGLGRPDGRAKLLNCCELHLRDATELFYKQLLGFGADTRYGIKLRGDLRFRPPVAVMGYAETVGLIAQLLDDPQRLGILVDIKRNRIAGKIYLLRAAWLYRPRR